MPSSKTPGTDGLPCEFYKVFWSDVGRIFINSLNYSYESGRLSMSQRRGIIKLIPKKDSDLNLFKNWGPLTLLNCVYKIATKAISNRIKTVLNCNKTEALWIGSYARSDFKICRDRRKGQDRQGMDLNKARHNTDQ